MREAAVVARDGPDGARLVACVVMDGHAVPPSDLRAFAAARLPGFMVPAAFAPVDALPRLPNGKLDRRALAGLAAVPGRPAERPFVAPRNAVEEQLAAAWSELLGVGRVGVDDNFFELGGHSLLATRLASRIRRDFGVELPLVRLFEAPNLAAQAEAVLALGLLREDGRELAELMAELAGMSEEETLARLAAADREMEVG